MSDPNPGTHTLLIPHNCFQSKGSCLSGPRRGLIARYKILRREGRAAGERGRERRERERCASTYFSPVPLSFPPFMLYLCWNLVSVKMVERTQTLCRSYRFWGKTFVLNTSEVCQTLESLDYEDYNGLLVQFSQQSESYFFEKWMFLLF